MDYGEIIRKCRKFRGMTLKEVAEKSGVSPVTINGWEMGITSPTLYNYEAVLNAMGFTLGITVKDK